MSQPITSAGEPVDPVPPALAGAAMPTPSQGVALIFVVLVLLLTVGMAVQGLAVYPGLLLTEVGLLLLPTLAVCRRLGLSPAVSLGLRLPDGAALGTALASGGAMGVLAFAMAICLTVPAVIVLLILGGRHPGVPLPLETFAHYVTAVVVGALVAPACEELLFRGLLMSSLRRHGLHAMVWVSAAAFGLFHLDPLRFIPTLALGVVFGYLTVAAGSVYPAMAAHAANNFLALTLGYQAGAGAGGSEPLTYEALRQQLLEGLPRSGLPESLARDPEVYVQLVIAGLVAGLLAAGLVLAALAGLWLWALLRRGAGGAPLPRALPAGRLLAIPWIWGIVGLGGVVWSLVIRSYWRG